MSGIGQGAVITIGGQPLGNDLPDEEDDGALKLLPERPVKELTAQRTLALREERSGGLQTSRSSSCS